MASLREVVHRTRNIRSRRSLPRPRRSLGRRGEASCEGVSSSGARSALSNAATGRATGSVLAVVRGTCPGATSSMSEPNPTAARNDASGPGSKPNRRLRTQAPGCVGVRIRTGDVGGRGSSVVIADGPQGRPRGGWGLEVSSNRRGRHREASSLRLGCSATTSTSVRCGTR